MLSMRELLPEAIHCILIMLGFGDMSCSVFISLTILVCDGIRSSINGNIPTNLVLLSFL